MNKISKIFVDSDPFVALAKVDDINHQNAVGILKSLIEQSANFFTSSYVFSECITVISMRVGHDEAIKFIDAMQSKESKFVVERIDESIEIDAVRVFKEQESKNTSFVDCTNMALIRKLHADAIFSFDTVYKQNGILMVADL